MAIPGWGVRYAASARHGGSLLNSALPPPPQDLPSPPKGDRGIEPRELLVISTSLEEAQALARQARALGFGIKRRRNLRGLGFIVTVLRPPQDARLGEALEVLRGSSPGLWADANHRYRLLGEEAKRYPARLVGWRASPSCGRDLSLGMIDTVPELDHPALQGRRIITLSFLPAGVRPAPPDHGTAVAALLVGDGPGLLPQARLYLAGVFRQRGKRAVDTTAELIVAGLDWLVTQKVRVINLGLGGPRNLLVEAAVARVLDAGIAVTAAAGNGGPQAPPVYPAAQPGVVAVTAVDARLAPYGRANRGEYIDFAAPGVDVWTAAPGARRIYATGTSYAVPFVTAALAATARKAPGRVWSEVLAGLAAGSRDLGAPGKDPVFGWGLVQASCGQQVAGVEGRVEAGGE